MVRPLRLTGLSALLAFAGMALPARAELLPPAPPAVVNWTGFYLGGDVGAIFNDARFVRPGSGLQEISIGTIDGRPTYGMYGGFNYQLSPWWVVGIEGNLNWLSAAYYRELGSAIDFLQEAHFVDSVAVRGGLLLRPDTMIYGKVGPAWIGVSGIQGFGTPFQQTLLGVQGAVGIEAMVTPNVSVRGEISYTYADQLSLNSGTDLYRPAFLMMQLGASYKFDPPAGWGVPAASRGPLSAIPYLPSLASLFPAPSASPILTKAERGAAVADPAPRWTGIEFGGFVSANANQVRYTDTLGGTPGGLLGPFTDFTVGGGWFVGANYQFERLVVGIEGSGNYENANFNTAAGSGGVVNFYHFANMDRVLALTGRLGWLMTPGTLLYGKAGPAVMRFTPDGNFWNAVAPNSVGGTGFAGYEAGIGIETYLLQNLSLRFEALYVHSGQTLVLNGVVPNEFTLQPSILSATLGLALHL
ncbi:MAG TPA: outer membrane beta-barrel protein [Xanthobacteraceae bacterium]|nr:outer membrane beta-barrel protein [Xanthobacteraceae bacterium]